MISGAEEGPRISLQFILLGTKVCTKV